MKRLISTAGVLAVALSLILVAGCGGGDSAGDLYDEHYDAGADLFIDGQWAASIVEFDAAIAADPTTDTDPTKGVVWGYRGAALWELVKDDSTEEEARQVLADLDKAVDLDRNAFVAMQYRGSVRYRLGMYEGAINDFELAMGSTHNPVAQTEMTFLRGLALVELGRLDDAREAFVTALQLSQDPELIPVIRAALDALPAE